MTSPLPLCPRCSRPQPDFSEEKRISCPECGFVLYLNVASAVGVLIRSVDRYLFIRRARNPGKGLLDIPGGFVDPGESAEEACRREIREELDVELEGLEYLSSEPNVYPYKDVVYRTCDLFFQARLKSDDMMIEEDEISETLWLKTDEIDPEHFAFESVRRFLQLILKRNT